MTDEDRNRLLDLIGGMAHAQKNLAELMTSYASAPDTILWRHCQQARRRLQEVISQAEDTMWRLLPEQGRGSKFPSRSKDSER